MKCMYKYLYFSITISLKVLNILELIKIDFPYIVGILAAIIVGGAILILIVAVGTLLIRRLYMITTCIY